MEFIVEPRKNPFHLSGNKVIYTSYGQCVGELKVRKDGTVDLRPDAQNWLTLTTRDLRILADLMDEFGAKASE